MYESNIGLKIDEFLNAEKKRISKINEKVSIITGKIQEIRNEINMLEDECVKCDLNDNIAGKEKAEKSITSLRMQLENLEGQSAAYERAKGNYKGSEKDVLKIQKDATNEIKKVQKLFQDKIDEKQALEASILQIKDKIRNIESEIEYFRDQPEFVAGQVAKIGNYIYGKGVLDNKVKANGGYFTKEKLVLNDLKDI